MSDQGLTAGTIPVAPESPVGHWVRWRERARGEPLAALDVGGRPHTAFVPDRLLVDAAESGLVKRLVERFGAEVVPWRPVPAPPDGLGPREGVNVDAMSLPVQLRLRSAPPASARAARLLAAVFDEPVAVTSEPAARLVGLVAELASEGMPVGLDVVGTCATLPLATVADSNPVDSLSVGANPTDSLAIRAYAGPARVGAAWQLVEAFRCFRAIKSPVTVGVLDGGFWLDGRVPAVSPAQPASDFGVAVAQLNLLDEDVGAGGANPNSCDGAFTCPWHGNGVASVATAKVGNGLGTAGVGGTVATPVLFKTDLNLSQVFRCLWVCIAWGIDILNMSWDITSAELFFPTTAWDNQFQQASDYGLIMVACAGNKGTRIPEDDNPRPATRTPGTITVGALDAIDRPAGFSNFGSSLDVWAPGVALPVMPDELNPLGTTAMGTSVAAPFVSGVLAMMRAVAPSLDPTRARQILVETGWRWQRSGKAGVGVDAFAAVLRAIGDRLPDDMAEPNNTPATAHPLEQVGNGRLTPFPGWRGDLAALSSPSNPDWYRFDVAAFSRFDLQLHFYELLGSVSVTIEPDDPDSRAQSELSTTYGPGFTRLTGLLAPGGYKVYLRGSVNLYELTVDLTAAPPPADELEPNDSFENAFRFRLGVPVLPVSPRDPPTTSRFTCRATGTSSGSKWMTSERS